MKPNTYTKLYFHAVFTPHGRAPILEGIISERVHKYINVVLREMKCYPIIINGTNDHIHILSGFPPNLSISDIVRDVKRSSSIFINNNISRLTKFSWQHGYGAFTVGYRELDVLFKYIQNQDEHHKEHTFRQEYYSLLDQEGIEYDQSYMFEFYDND